MSAVHVARAAERIAREAFEDVTDKAGEPYVGHLERVAVRMRLQPVRGGLSQDDIWLDVAVAWLHDLIEDTGWTPARLVAAVPISVDLVMWNEVVRDVERLTHRQNEQRLTYYARVRESARATRVKLADVEDNSDAVRLAHLPDEDIVRLVKKYAKAKTVLLAL